MRLFLSLFASENRKMCTKQQPDWCRVTFHNSSIFFVLILFICRTKIVRWYAQQEVQWTGCSSIILWIWYNWWMYGATWPKWTKQRLCIRYIFIETNSVDRHKSKSSFFNTLCHSFDAWIICHINFSLLLIFFLFQYETGTESKSNDGRLLSSIGC